MRQRCPTNGSAQRSVDGATVSTYPPPTFDSGSRMLAYARGVKVNCSHAWGYFDRALIMVPASGVPADADWDEFLADSHHDPGEVIIIVAGESKLTPQQRIDVQRWQERHGTRAVLVTDSLLARGVATALSWFRVKVQAFARRDLDRALAAAGIAESDRAAATNFVERLTIALEEYRKHSLVG
jgi:hypothetical protein